MHLVAGGFHDQPQGISAVPVLIHDQHLKFWVVGRLQVGFTEMDSRISLTFMKSAGLTKW